MTPLETAVQRARLAICVALCSRPSDVRARLPFDPSDEGDVTAWATTRLAELGRAGPPGHLAKRLEWDARNLARPRRACTMCESELPLGMLASRRAVSLRPASDPHPLPEFIEELAKTVATAAADASGLQATMCARSASAALSCIARVAHTLDQNVEPEDVVAFVDASLRTLGAENGLPGCMAGAFRTMIGRMQQTDNYRRDLRQAGWSCPGHKQWLRFLDSLASVMRERGTYHISEVSRKRERRTA